MQIKLSITMIHMTGGKSANAESASNVKSLLDLASEKGLPVYVNGQGIEELAPGSIALIFGCPVPGTLLPLATKLVKVIIVKDALENADALSAELNSLNVARHQIETTFSVRALIQIGANFVYPFAAGAQAVTVFVLLEDGALAVLVERLEEPFSAGKGFKSAIGGFYDPQSGLTLRQAAVQILKQKINVDVAPGELIQLETGSGPRPDARDISVVDHRYLYILPSSAESKFLRDMQAINARGVSAVRLVPVVEMLNVALAFDHADALYGALADPRLIKRAARYLGPALLDRETLWRDLANSRGVLVFQKKPIEAHVTLVVSDAGANVKTIENETGEHAKKGQYVIQVPGKEAYPIDWVVLNQRWEPKGDGSDIWISRPVPTEMVRLPRKRTTIWTPWGNLTNPAGAWLERFSEFDFALLDEEVLVKTYEGTDARSKAVLAKLAAKYAGS